MKKHTNVRAIYKSLFLLSMPAMMWGCKKDIFDKKDLNGIDTDVWNVETAATLFVNKTYDLIMPNWPVAGAMHNTSDETASANTTLLYGTLTDNSVVDIASNNTSSTNTYFNIRRCNVAITGLENGQLPADVKAKLKGQIYFLRAFAYFNLVKLYGGVPIVLKSQDLNTDTLNVPRSKTSECIKQIVRDLDSCYGLPASWTLATDGGRITRMAALAFKGKVLMYWASPQFNPNGDAARWTAAYQACKAAYDSCAAQGYGLMSSFSGIFLDETASNKERLLWRTYDAVSVNPGRGTNLENQVRPFSETSAGGGAYQPTWNLVQAFTMSNGLPITDAASKYDATLFWQNRDPRFDATIAYNGATWALSSKAGRKQWNYADVAEDKSKQSATGFYCRKLSNPNISAAGALYNSNTGGGSGMDWVEMRFAEVLLNLAECANATGQLEEARSLVIALRKRAGIVAGDYNYGLSIVNNKQQMQDVIMNERMVEFAMEGKRYDDLRRNRLFHTLTGTVRSGFKWTVKSPYVLGTTGSDASKIYIEKPNAVTGIMPRDTANLNNASVYNAMFTTSTFSLDTNSPINYPTTYYFYPLPTNFRLSSPLIEQTIGWPGGTFDPLQ